MGREGVTREKRRKEVKDEEFLKVLEQLKKRSLSESSCSNIKHKKNFILVKEKRKPTVGTNTPTLNCSPQQLNPG